MATQGNFNQDLALLVSMGFPESLARTALTRANGDVGMAIDILSGSCKFHQ